MYDRQGVDGQGPENKNPRSLFEQHYLARYAFIIYDPSYGTAPQNSGLAWENASISAFAMAPDAEAGTMQFRRNPTAEGVPSDVTITWGV